MQIQLVLALLRLIHNLSSSFNLNFVAVCIKYRCNTRYILAKTRQNHLLYDFTLMFARPFKN